jgi:hypothetical protein
VPTLETFGPIKVADGTDFVTGDNRDYSFDSRDPRYGLISVQEIRGRPLRIVKSAVSGRAGKDLK